jgi:hypothetical protein
MLMTIIGIHRFLIGSFNIADCTLPVYMMGPKLCRPFTNAVHAIIRLGFLGGAFLVQPFLPGDATAARARDEVCPLPRHRRQCYDKHCNTIVAEPEVETLLGIDTIAWPYIISGLWGVIFSFGFIILGE